MPSNTDSTPPTAASAAVAETAAPRKRTKPPGGFWDFLDLLANVPLGERSLRTEIKRGRIPSIRLPGGRRLLFHPASVEAALLRYQKGGLE